jgi:outer membrane protein
MKNKIFVPLLLVASSLLMAQNSTKLTLEDAIEKGLANSKAIKFTEAGIQSAEAKSKSVKNNQLPDLSISGQYQQILSKGTTKIKLPIPTSENSPFSTLSPDHVMLGTAGTSMPIFAGNKINNSIKQSKLAIDVSKLQNDATKEDVVWQVINLYFGLYKTQKTIDVLNENLARAEQRVIDFKNFLDNGIIAKNDYLSAKLQVSNVKIAIEDASNTYNNLNYRLNILIGNPTTEKHEIVYLKSKEINNSSESLTDRKDIQTLEKQTEIADKSIAIAKAGYYPQLAFTANYYAMDIDKIATITNSITLGLGLKYDLSSLYKNKHEVNFAKAKKVENELQLEMVKDKARIEIYEAQQKYELADKKNKVYDEALQQATENYRIVKDKYDNGLEDTDHLLEADVQQLQAKINKVVGEADQDLAGYEYLYTQGKLIENIQ